MATIWLNSLSSPFVPPARRVYQLDGSDSGLLAYLAANTPPRTTGGYAVDRSGSPALLTWKRYLYDMASSTYVLGSTVESMTLPSTGLVVAVGRVDPPAPSMFDPEGWWACDLDGAPLDLREIQSTSKVSKTKVVTGRAIVTSGSLAAGASDDLPISFDATAPVLPDSGWVQIQPAPQWAGKTTAVIIAGSITTTGCTVRVTASTAVGPGSTSAPIVYDVVCPYTVVEDA